MVREAEEFATKDKARRKRIESQHLAQTASQLDPGVCADLGLMLTGILLAALRQVSIIKFFSNFGP